MMEGTASYPRNPRSEAQRAQARQATDPVSAAQAAMRREAIPTLAEVMAAMPQVTEDSGALMPGKLAARGNRGFDGADANRDSADAEKLTRFVREMDRIAAQVYPVRTHDHVDRAYMLAELWTRIRKITQANTDRPNREVTQ